VTLNRVKASFTGNTLQGNTAMTGSTVNDSDWGGGNFLGFLLGVWHGPVFNLGRGLISCWLDLSQIILSENDRICHCL